MKQTNYFVAVEANIAAGKSTLLPKLAKLLDWDPIQEPVNDPMFTELLHAFTSQPNDSVSRIKLQQYITERRANLISKLPSDRNYLIERSLYSDLIFTQANFLAIDQPDENYMLHYCEIQRKLNDYPAIGAILYLKTSPEIAHNRLIQRDRKAESGTPLHYLQDIHHYHEALLPQICRSMNTPLITMDWDCYGDTQKVADRVLSVLNLQQEAAA